MRYLVNRGVGNFPAKISEYLLREAELAESVGVVSGNERGHIAALRQVAGYLRSAYKSGIGDAEDPSAELVLLAEVSSLLGRGVSDPRPYVPSPLATKFIATLGDGVAVDSASAVVCLMAAELHDYAAAQRGAEHNQRLALQQRDEAVRARDAAVRRAAEATASAQAAEEELDSLKARLREAEEARAYLLRRVEAFDTPDAEPVASTDADEPAEDDLPTAEQLEATLDKRRVPLGGGLYLSRSKGETHYEIHPTESTWERVGTVSSGMTISQARERLARRREAAKAVTA